jgi:tol-pal system protein YbgF
MTRRSLLPQACPIALLALLALAAPSPTARSQDRSMQDRLDRVERDLSMLQRQVYRVGGAAPSGGGGNIAVDTQIRMDRLEQQMRDLTGRVESQTNEVQQLRQRLEQINSDIDVRFSQGQGDGQGGSHPRTADSVASRGPPPRPSSAALTAYSGTMSHGPPPPPPPPEPAPPPSQGTLTPPGMHRGPPPAPVAAAGGAHPPGRGMLPSGSASEQYNNAFGLLKRADYPAAEEALRAFLQQHPNDPLAGNAQYWLGESYYARGKYAEAAGAFAEGYKRYPRSPKAADDLLKLGMSLGRANQKQNACIALIQLDHDFPHAGSTVKDRAAAEKKRLGC